MSSTTPWFWYFLLLFTNGFVTFIQNKALSALCIQRFCTFNAIHGNDVTWWNKLSIQDSTPGVVDLWQSSLVWSMLLLAPGLVALRRVPGELPKVCTFSHEGGAQFSRMNKAVSTVGKWIGMHQLCEWMHECGVYVCVLVCMCMCMCICVHVCVVHVTLWLLTWLILILALFPGPHPACCSEPQCAYLKLSSFYPWTNAH